MKVIIYGDDAKEIQELLEGESEVNKQLVLAELYLKAGLIKRAENALKGYKKILDKTENKDEKKQINKAIEIIKGSGKNKQGIRTKWQALWDEKIEAESKEKKEPNSESILENDEEETR